MSLQPDKKSRRKKDEIEWDIPSYVSIPGTRRVLKMRGMKPYTMERLTALWVEREDMSELKNTSDTLKSMCREPYFTIKEAVLMWLNSVWKITLFFPIIWRWWAYVREYTEEQMMEIIQEGKKKIPLTAHWTNMAFSADMRTDWKKLTQKEAEEYRAELLSVASRLSSRSSQNMAGQGSE